MWQRAGAGTIPDGVSIIPNRMPGSRTTLLNAFIRNYHRANRWHLAAMAMAEKMQFLEACPVVRPS